MPHCPAIFGHRFRPDQIVELGPRHSQHVSSSRIKIAGNVSQPLGNLEAPYLHLNEDFVDALGLRHPSKWNDTT
ncbi:hypothetical protein MPL3365_290091 [Mesorhizobium plurifarium]|uniref:Uncharacterized protein n=1 Tax=Mesorhizobium plurifarium TaxID=69974 RepID=A0A090GDL4_MESPL|nr:hypothetical protein MPL3365_290091 [Mesorhizobium plurifarium]